MLRINFSDCRVHLSIYTSRFPRNRPEYRKHVPREGLPLPECPKEKGCLVLTFNVEFPMYLPMSSKNYVKRAFDDTGGLKDTEYIHRLILADKIRKNVDYDVPLRRDPNDHEAKKLEFICNS